MMFRLCQQFILFQVIIILTAVELIATTTTATSTFFESGFHTVRDASSDFSDY